ncbi:MAG: bifunctional folylpolyglutamate synthase/dihydrofolate synthase [Hyphomicrobiaceae bacterium]
MPKSDQLLAELKELHPKLIDLSLGRIERLLGKMGNPHHRLPPVIHIAGTNGKGSTGAFIKAILQAAGLRVHVYTSPHLVTFHERISLACEDGTCRPIAEDALCDILERAQAANDKDDITQFEITTAAAFLAFSETPADVLLLEVGLGGRLDATNVIAKPALTVITPVSIDHADKLGDTLAKIAMEKAGILKRGVPAIVSMQQESAMSVIRATADKVGAKLRAWGEDFDAYEQSGRLVVQNQDQLLDLPLPSLVGRHQITNAGTAVAAVIELKNFDISEQAIEQGLVSARWPARMERLHKGPLTDTLRSGTELWVDGGHNPAAGEALAQTLAELDERSPKPVYLIVGMLGIKDVVGFLSPFRGVARHVLTVPVADAPEATQTPQRLAEAADEVGLTAEAMPNVREAIRHADGLIVAPKRILICGSLYLAGETLGLHEGVLPEANP